MILETKSPLRGRKGRDEGGFGIHPRRRLRRVLGGHPSGSDGGFERYSRLEWLETNGLGGWAASSVAGVNTRRYHGLLVAAAFPPLGRVVLLSKLDETLVVGGRRLELASNQYPGLVQPQGYRLMRRFSRGLLPRARFEVEGLNLTRTVVGIHGENTTVVEYRIAGPADEVRLELRPLIAGREFHALGRAREAPPWSFDGEAGLFRSGPWAEGQTLWMATPGAGFEAAPDWYHDVEYLREMERGLDYREDLWTPGVLSWEMPVPSLIRIVVSAARPERPAGELLDREVRRRRSLVRSLPRRDPITAPLALAADQFIVRRGDGRSVIAGYPWFGDWGRDTMIALPGLCLATGRHDDAREVLRTWAAAMTDGMLPNRFPDSGAPPEFNSVDATLWFFVAARSYLEHTGDRDFVRSHLLPSLRDAERAYRRGTRFGIREDRDGLLLAGEPGQQVTWMDARAGGWVVTPRAGKAVEVNALWYNALRILAEMEDHFGEAGAATALAARARRTRHRFARAFWYEEGGYLYDVLGGDGTPDPSLRPNQILALSLPFPLVSAQRARRVLAATRRLLTPFGVRTLSPEHPGYRGRYEGGPESRDGAYHQGTVWAWLLGPYITALARWEGKRGRLRGLVLLEEALLHLPEAGVGTISELFDAEPDYRPGGAVAQAWSVAELLRCYLEDLRPAGPRSVARETGEGE